ncbi:MAG: SPOR domain-containing protein [Methylococcaceae bacterium]
MTRDYKPRPNKGKFAGQQRHHHAERAKVGLWRWMLITTLIISFVVFLVYLGTNHKEAIPTALEVTANKTLTENSVAIKEEKKPEVKQGPQPPQFDFYTILPEKEIEVPEYEIKTRTREEHVGKAKEAHYILQVGSFKTMTEAETLKTKLAGMGMESTIQKQKIGIISWYRVKMGPYTQMPSINTIRGRLRQNGIDVIITETGE